jgi:flagellar basal body rod protein FlgB
MNLSSTTTDNVTELLVKIREFTERRRRILMQNVKHIDTVGFVPKDLDVTEFADVMTEAILEHIQSKRLLLRDSENIKFGKGGSFESPPIVDEHAKRLFENDTAEYLELQIRKLSENLINNRVAAELLGQRHGRS